MIQKGTARAGAVTPAESEDDMKYIYSENEERMLVKEVEYLGKKYIWNEEDELYYWEKSEELTLTLDFVESKVLQI